MRPGCAGEISITLVCTVTDVFTAPSFQALQNAGDFYIWNDTFLRKRLDYKPDLPLYCILARASTTAAAANAFPNVRRTPDANPGSTLPKRSRSMVLYQF